MRTWWDSWATFPSSQRGWFLGAEKQAALNENLTQYEDFKGLVSELRFYDRAKSTSELQQLWSVRPAPGASGLVGWFRMVVSGQSGQTCDDFAASRCFSLSPLPGQDPSTVWSPQTPPQTD
jgi:hypothetical protein